VFVNQSFQQILLCNDCALKFRHLLSQVHRHVASREVWMHANAIVAERPGRPWHHPSRSLKPVFGYLRLQAGSVSHNKKMLSEMYLRMGHHIPSGPEFSPRRERRQRNQEGCKRQESDNDK